MPPLPQRDLTLGEVESILRRSEGRTSVYRADEDPGHAYGRHVALPKTELYARLDETRNGKVALYTAFLTSADQIGAAQETLNSVEGKWARDQFFQGAPTTRHPRGGHNGMSAVIYFVGRVRQVRYAGGAGIMPVSDYKMLLARDDGRPLNLHVKTFFATMREAGPQHRVEVFGRDDRLYRTGP